jgi:hypothetical protein
MSLSQTFCHGNENILANDQMTDMCHLQQLPMLSEGFVLGLPVSHLYVE